jgi:hypothetical protein
MQDRLIQQEKVLFMVLSLLPPKKLLINDRISTPGGKKANASTLSR